MFRFPWGDMHSLNLGWFLQKFNELREDWATAEAGIDGALDAEIQRAEDALSDVFAARDAAAASASAANSSALNASQSSLASMDARDQSRAARDAAQQAATNAAGSETAAGNSATAASNSAGAAATSATQAGNSATAAGNSATAAGQSATNAAASETAAGNSAAAAAASETAAGNSARDAEDAAASVEASAQQILTNTNDIISLKDAMATGYSEKALCSLLYDLLLPQTNRTVSLANNAIVKRNNNYIVLSGTATSGYYYHPIRETLTGAISLTNDDFVEIPSFLKRAFADTNTLKLVAKIFQDADPNTANTCQPTIYLKTTIDSEPINIQLAIGYEIAQATTLISSGNNKFSDYNYFGIIYYVRPRNATLHHTLSFEIEENTEAITALALSN